MCVVFVVFLRCDNITVMSKAKYTLKITTSTLGVDQDNLKHSIDWITKAVPLCTLATVEKDGTPDICNAYYGVTPKLQIVIMTSPQTQHIKNLRAHSRVAVDVTDTMQSPSAKKFSIEIEGVMRPAKMNEMFSVIVAYIKRMSTAPKSRDGNSIKLSKMLHSKAYIVDVDKIKVMDEINLGTDIMYAAEVSR